MAQTMSQTHGASGPMHSLQHHDGLSNGSNIPLYPNENPQQSEELFKRSVMIVIWYKVSSPWASLISLRLGSETLRYRAVAFSCNSVVCLQTHRLFVSDQLTCTVLLTRHASIAACDERKFIDQHSETTF